MAGGTEIEANLGQALMDVSFLLLLTSKTELSAFLCSPQGSDNLSICQKRLRLSKASSSQLYFFPSKYHLIPF